MDDQDGGTSTRTFDVDYRPQLAVDSVVINGGDAGRSVIETVEVAFSEKVAVDKSSFVLRNRDTGELLRSYTLDVEQGVSGAVAQLSFLSQMVGVPRAVPDGNYELVVSASGVQPLEDVIGALSVDQVFGDEASDGFFQLYGDSDGDRDVDLVDYAAFAQTFGKSASDVGFDAAFDSDGDGDGDGIDLGRLRRGMMRRASL